LVIDQAVGTQLRDGRDIRVNLRGLRVVGHAEGDGIVIRPPASEIAVPGGAEDAVRVPSGSMDLTK